MPNVNESDLILGEIQDFLILSEFAVSGRGLFIIATRKLYDVSIYQFISYWEGENKKELKTIYDFFKNEAKKIPSIRGYVLIPNEAVLVRAGAIRRPKGVEIVTKTGYFNLQLGSSDVCREVIRKADSLILKERYVKQRAFIEDNGAVNSFSFVVDEGSGWIYKPKNPLLLILAPPAFGKTTLVHSLGREIAERHLGNKEAPLPFLISLDKYKYIKTYREIINQYLSDIGRPELFDKAIAYLVNTRRIILIIDGFDELAEISGIRVARETFKNLLEAFSGGAKIIIASRERYFWPRTETENILPANFNGVDLTVLNLEPFNEYEIKTYFQKNLPEGLPYDKYLELALGLQDTDLAGNPFVLSVISESISPDNLPRSINELERTGLLSTLLTKCITSFCEREKTRQAEEIPVEDQMDIFADIAEDMFIQSTPEEPREVLDFAIEQSLHRKGFSGDELRRRVDRFSLQLSSHPFTKQRSRGTGEGNGEVVGFRHAIIRDFLLAVKCVRLLEYVKEKEGRLKEAFFNKQFPTYTLNFLADQVDFGVFSEFALANKKWPNMFRNLFSSLSLKAEAEGLDTIEDKTGFFEQYLGKPFNFSNVDLSGFKIDNLEFYGTDFRGANLTNTIFTFCDFQGCLFENFICPNCRCYNCEFAPADKLSLYRQGVAGVPEPEMAYSPPVDLKDPVIKLTVKFFRRFFRGNETVLSPKEESFYQGIRGKDLGFTRSVLIPTMLKNSIITRRKIGKNRVIYDFNRQWLSVGVKFLGFPINESPVIDPKLEAIIETLQEKYISYS